MSDVTDRLAALEAAVAANALPATLAILQRKLEQNWQPDASVLLQPGSVTLAMLGIARGATSATWTAAATSADIVVKHGLGVVPTHGEATGVATTLFTYSIVSKDATNITFKGQYIPNTALSGTVNLTWAAFA